MLLVLLSGCAFGPGQAFGDLTEATLTAALVPGERAVGGEILTDQGYAVRVDALVVSFEVVELLAAVEGAAPEEEGHAHDHGAEEEEAPAEEAASLAPLVTLPVGAAADLVAGAAYTLDVSGWDQLPAAEILEVEIDVPRFTLTGSVRHHPDDDGWSAPLTVDLAVEGAMAADVDVDLSRDEDPTLSFAVAVEPDGTLFDGLVFDDLAGAEGVVLDELADPGADTLGDALLAVVPVVTVERSP